MKIHELVDLLGSCDSWGTDGFYTIATGRKDETTHKLLTEHNDLILQHFNSLSQFATYLFGIGEARNYLDHCLFNIKYAGLCDLDELRKIVKMKKLKAEKGKLDYDTFQALRHTEQIKLLNSFMRKGKQLVTDFSNEYEVSA